MINWPPAMDSSIKLELLRHKEEHAHSAVASLEVREHLAGFIRSKRLGSSTNNITSSASGTITPGSSNAIQKLGFIGGQQDAKRVAGSHRQQHGRGTMGVSGQNQNDDHPLRKTASMPSMHIPYKAQSLSRRHQIERRTTMSPLTKRNSRTKRQPLHSMDSSSLEYSSNTFVIHSSSKTNERSPSRSSSPSQQSSSCNTKKCCDSDLIKATTSTTCDPTKSSTQPQVSSVKLGFTMNKKMDMNSQLKSYCPSKPNSSAGNIHHQVTQQQQQQQHSGACLNPADKAAAITRQHQQHLKVNEAIRKKVIQRRGKIVVGGSLDIDNSSSAAATSGGGRGANELGKSVNLSDKLRQWSLDGVDPRLVSSSNPGLPTPMDGMMPFNGCRDFNTKLRLESPADAACLRRSQSPSGSLTMGLAAINQPMASSPPRHHHLQSSSLAAHQANHRASFMSSHVKQFSSSSSSTSSLLSPQDSLEERSPRAIDLSSSSEVSRHQRWQSPSQAAFQSTSQQATSTSRQQPLPSPLIRSTSQVTTGGQQYHKVLQESFNQLQLCKQPPKYRVLNKLPSSSTLQQQVGRTLINSALLNLNKAAVGMDSTAEPSANDPRDQGRAPTLSSLHKAAMSLDAASCDIRARNASLSSQLNMSASVQSLMDERHHNNQIAESSRISQTQELNQWLLLYNQLVQSNDAQQSNQINSSLLQKMSSIPEPYKSRLLAHLIQLQQQQQQQQQLLLGTTDSASHVMYMAGGEQEHVRSIGRALSSPLLASADSMSVQDFGSNLRTVNPQAECFMDEPMDFRADPATIAPGQKVSQSDFLSEPRTEKAKDSRTDDDEQRSLDLTVSSSSRDRSSEYSASLSGQPSGHEEPSRIPKANLEPLNFKYMPKDSKCSYILNPVFDQNSSTGLTYDLRMCNHKCICNNENNHTENSFRVLAIWRRLYESGLMARCAQIESRKATLEELQLYHSHTYAHYFGESPYERIKLNSQLDLGKLPVKGLIRLECGGLGADIDTAWDEERTPDAARLAAGCVIEATAQVARGCLLNAFAIVRPPGHHAEHKSAMGFCFFNSLVLAAKLLINKHKLERILIVDWDAHHGNGIQKAFYEDKSVMYISLHRYDMGNFFPGTGDPKEIGLGVGEGYNWNIAWSNETMGDSEYLAAFRALVLPIADDFNPSMVLVASGFDAATGHPHSFGGYKVSAACFGQMTRQLMNLANGRLVLCLEGGYNLESISDCSEACVRALLNEPPLSTLDRVSDDELRRAPNLNAVKVITMLSELACKYWPSVEQWRNSIELSTLDASELFARTFTQSS